jgi:hypothetical protein
MTLISSERMNSLTRGSGRCSCGIVPVKRELKYGCLVKSINLATRTAAVYTNNAGVVEIRYNDTSSRVQGALRGKAGNTNAK